MREGSAACVECPQGFWCGPGGVVDYSNGSFYATAGLHACADPSGGSLLWTEEDAGAYTSTLHPKSEAPHPSHQTPNKNTVPARKVDIRLPGKENSNSRGARPVY